MVEAPPHDIVQALEAASDRVGPIGARLVYHTVTSSTNDVAIDLAAAGAEDWTTVLAGSQTAGRGRRGRRWFSEADAGLYFSTIMRGIESATVTLMAGVAVADGVREATGLPVEIKWPNDVILPRSRLGRVRPLKVAGILAEACRIRDAVDAVVVGIGVNVASTSYPAEVEAVAGSLSDGGGRAIERAPVLVEILAALTKWRGVMADGRLGEVLARWRELAPTSQGTAVEWSEQGRRRAGVTDGIEADGALRVRSGSRVERLIAGEVTWHTRNLPQRSSDAAGDRRR